MNLFPRMGHSMKPRRLFFIQIVVLIVLIFAGPGCALLGRATEDISPSAATAVVPELPTSAPVLPTPTPSQPTLQPAPTEASSIEPTAPSPLNPLPPGSPGPEVLDLEDPDLYTSPLTDYTASYAEDVTSSGLDDKPVTILMRYAARYQTQPTTAWASNNSMFDETTRVDMVTVGGKLYVAAPDGQCETGTPGDPPPNPVSALADVFQGQVQRTEENVEINGLIADRYALEAENLVPEAQIVLAEKVVTENSNSDSTLTLQIHGTGSLYLARQGGFIVRVELSDISESTEQEFFFKPGSDMQSQTVIELAPTEPDAAPIAPPEACGSAPQAGSGGGSGGGTLVFPRPDDAEILIEDEGSLVYQTSQAPDDLETFYTTEMAALGFSLEDTTKLGPIVELTFTRADQTVTVSLLPAGDTVTVTITAL